jgi:soluble lytic murein transglycosylase
MPVMPPIHAPARDHHWTTAIIACALAALVSTQTACAGNPLARQRAAFRAAYTAAQNGQNWRPLAKGLKGYPLYPYLEAAALQHDIHTAGRARIDAYLHRYKGMIPAHAVRVAELHWLAKQKDWRRFGHFYRAGLGTTLTCDALKAKLAQGKRLDFHRDLAALWQKSHLPSACNPVLQAAFAQGLLTPPRVWDRIERDADAGRSGAVAYSARWLTGTERTSAQRIAKAVSAPATLLGHAAAFADTSRNR